MTSTPESPVAATPESQVGALESQVGALRVQLLDYQNEVNNAKSQIQGYQVTLASLTSDLAGTRKELDDAASVLRASIDDSNVENVSKLGQLLEIMKTKYQQLVDSGNGNADKDNQIRVLNEKVIELTNKITELRSAPSQSSQSAESSLSPSHRFASQAPDNRAAHRVSKLGGQSTKHPHVNHLRRSELGVEIAQKQLEQKQLTQQLTQSYPERQAEKQKERDHVREQNKAKRQLEKATETETKALKLAKEAKVKHHELEITKLTHDKKKVCDEARDLRQEATTDMSNADRELLLAEAKELEAKAAKFDVLLLEQQDALSQIA